MVNVYKEIMAHKEAMHGTGFKELLDDLGILPIFLPLYSIYQQELTVKKIVLYILYAYSWESTKIAVSADRQTEKKAIYDSLNMPYENEEQKDALYRFVVIMEERTMVQVIQKWIEYQGNTAFQYYITLKDSYAQMQEAALLPLTNGNGGIDYNQKQKCIEYMTETGKLIKEAEANLIQNSPKLKSAISELKQVQKNNRIGPETYAK